MTKAVKEKYGIGDIVFVNDYSYDNDITGSNHLFVVVNDDNDNFTGDVKELDFTVNKAASSVEITVVIDGVFNTTNATIGVNVENATITTFNITGDNFEVNGEITKLNETLSGLTVSGNALSRAFSSLQRTSQR